MGVALLIASGVALAECPVVGEHVDAAEQALLLGDVDGAAAQLAEAEDGFSCGALPTQETLARFWLAQGVLDAFRNTDDAAADPYFQAAARVNSAVWNDAYGDKLRAHYDQVPTSLSEGTLVLQPGDAGYPTWLNAEATALPQVTTGGWYLVQLGEAEDVQYGKLVFVDGDTFLSHSVPPRAQVADVPEATPERSGRPGLVVAASGALLAGGAFGMTAYQAGQARAATDVDDLDRAYKRQNGSAYAGYGLLGVAAAGLTFHLVF